MKEIVLLVSTTLPACTRLLNNTGFRSSLSSIKIPFKFLFVDDERTRNILIKANKPNVPMLYIDTGDGILDIRGVSNIIKVLKDMVDSQKQPPVQDISEITELLKEEKPEVLVYSNNNHSIYHIDCSKYNDDLDDKYTNVIISEHCKKEGIDLEMSMENPTALVVNTANITSMKQIVALLQDTTGPFSFLVVSKNISLAETVVALTMFYIEKRSLDTIQKHTKINIKKPLLKLFVDESYEMRPKIVELS